MTRSRDVFAHLEALLFAVARGEVAPDDAFLDFMWQHADKRVRIPPRSKQTARRARFLAQITRKVCIYR